MKKLNKIIEAIDEVEKQINEEIHGIEDNICKYGRADVYEQEPLMDFDKILIMELESIKDWVNQLIDERNEHEEVIKYLYY